MTMALASARDSDTRFSFRIRPPLNPRRYLMLLCMISALTLNSVTSSLDNVTPQDYLLYFQLLFYALLFVTSVKTIEVWGLKVSIVIALTFQTFATFFG